MKEIKIILFILLLIAMTSCKKETKIDGNISLSLPTSATAITASKAESIINTAKTIDYRLFQTSVKNQGQRGTCSAFSVASVLEILPGVPADISEQYLYGAIKHSQPNTAFSEGNFLGNYVKSLNLYGFIHEKQLPYNPNKNKWEDNDTEFVKIIKGTHLGKVSLHLLKYYAKYSLTTTNQFKYFGYADSSNPEVIKQLLNSGVKSVAVAYTNIHVPTWSKGICTSKSPIDVNTTFDFYINGKEVSVKDVKATSNGDIVQAINSKKVQYTLKDDKEQYGGHAVNIVGYNDKGFIIKNSWGKDWADNGYGYISYDLHKLTCIEALVITNVTFVKPKTSINPNQVSEFYLKSTLSDNDLNGKKYFQLSIFTSDIIADPLITSVTYTIYGRNSKLLASKTKLAGLDSNAYDNSFTVDFFKNELMEPDLLFGKPVNIVAEIYSDANKGKKVYYFNDIHFKTAEYKSSFFKKVSNLIRSSNE